MNSNGNQVKSDMTNTEAYRVLARKYRPKDFSDLIGQQAMVQTLSNAFKTDRIAQAYMLTGVRGVGKTTTARILARALNFQTDELNKPNIDLSEDGIHCQMIMEGRHPDVIEMDAASNTGIDDIRDLISSAQYAPVSARFKVFIIDEVHMLSKAAFNGLLKTLEEPPAHVKFIFATTEIRKVPVTVLSRCQRFDLRRIDAEILCDHIKLVAQKENIEISNEAALLIARAGEGSVRDCLSILDQAIAHASGIVEAPAVRAMLGLADRARIIDLFEHIMGGDIVSALAELKAQYDVGADPVIVLADLATFTHFVTRLKFVPSAGRDVSEEESKRGLELSKKLATRTLGRIWQMLLKGGQEVQSARDPFAAAEMVLIRLAHASDLPSPEQAIEQLKNLSGNSSSGPQTEAKTISPSDGDNAPQAVSHKAASRPQLSGSSGQAMSSASQANLVTQFEGQPMSKSGIGGPQLAVSNPKPQMLSESEQNSLADLSIYKSLSDLVELAQKHRDLRLKNALRNDVKLVHMAPPSLSLALAEGTNHSVIQLIAESLTKLTGSRWVVSISNETGDPTLGEQERELHSQKMADAESHPVVMAIKNVFPRSQVVDVRLREDFQASELAIDDEDNDMMSNTHDDKG